MYNERAIDNYLENLDSIYEGYEAAKQYDLDMGWVSELGYNPGFEW